MNYDLTPEQAQKILDNIQNDEKSSKQVIKESEVVQVEEVDLQSKTFVDASDQRSRQIAVLRDINGSTLLVPEVTSDELPSETSPDDNRLETLPAEPSAKSKKPTLAELFPVKTWLEHMPKGYIRTSKVLHPIQRLPEPERTMYASRRPIIMYRGFEYWLDQFCGPVVIKRMKQFAEFQQRFMTQQAKQGKVVHPTVVSEPYDIQPVAT